MQRFEQPQLPSLLVMRLCDPPPPTCMCMRVRVMYCYTQRHLDLSKTKLLSDLGRGVCKYTCESGYVCVCLYVCIIVSENPHA